MWGDINRVVGKHYKDLFEYLENCEVLDCLAETHLLALHLIYLPRINKSLSEFQLQWNHHPLRTMNNRSPLALWQIGEHPELNNAAMTQKNLLAMELIMMDLW